MSNRFILTVLLTIFTTISINAQKQIIPITKIKLGEKSVMVKGKIFNEILYSFTSGKSKYVAYFYVDKVKKALIISELAYEFEGEKAIVTVIETYICPLVKIDKQNSYNIEMEDESIVNGKYLRLTLVSIGQGADNLYFQKQTQSANNKRLEIKAVNNVTINIINKSNAEKWLKEFTKVNG